MARAPSGGDRSPATITDVARAADVSIKTVSRVMNEEKRVRPETRARVLEAAQALNYRPNVMARSLAAGRPFLVGLVYNNPSIHYVNAIQVGAMKRSAELGLHIVMAEPDSAENAITDLLQLAAETRLAGLILTPPIGDAPGLIDALLDADMKLAVVAPAAPRAQVAQVRMDDVRAAYEITQLLIAKGHRRIAMIKGPPSHGASHWRATGFSQALTQAGIPIDPELFATGDFSFRSALAPTEKLLRLEAPPTAIFASNDDMAAGVIATAMKLGISVPERLSVVGFDDSPIATIVWPHLTTVRQPIADMAARALDLLVAGDSGADAEELAFDIIERGSTATPPAFIKK